MRLSEEQIQQIHQVLETRWHHLPYKLYLYGSRVHDYLKGGDIDLLLVTNEEGLGLFRELELDLLVQIKKQPAIGQRRVDLKAALEKDLKLSPFLKEIAHTMVELKK